MVLLTYVLLSLFASLPTSEPGPLLIVGGGPIPDEVYNRALKECGHANPRVVVIPWASEQKDAGVAASEKWSKLGAASATILPRGDLESAQTLLNSAQIIWLGGGSQSRLVDSLKAENLVEVLKKRHKEGVLVGGTSAGAAAMSLLMMTGKAELDALVAGSTEMVEGLGLWPETIVDQHFHRRGRFNRLLAAVIAHPSHLGVGIDESTAVFVRGDRLEVVGKSSVLLIDARDAQELKSKEQDVLAGRDIRLHLLAPGMSFLLKEGTQKKD